MINYHEFSIENRIFLLENFYGSLKRHMENLFDIDLFDFTRSSRYFSNRRRYLSFSLVSNTKWYSFLVFNDVSFFYNQKN